MSGKSRGGVRIVGRGAIRSGSRQKMVWVGDGEKAGGGDQEEFGDGKFMGCDGKRVGGVGEG